jgi:hypothetical protein
MYTVWHVDKYKITFKLVFSCWTNKMSFKTHSRILFSSEYFHYKIFIHEKFLKNSSDNFQGNLSQHGIIDFRARYRAVARQLRNTGVVGIATQDKLDGPWIKTWWGGEIFCTCPGGP